MKDYIITPYIGEFINTLTNITYGPYNLQSTPKTQTNSPTSHLRSLWSPPRRTQTRWRTNLNPRIPLLGSNRRRCPISLVPRDPKIPLANGRRPIHVPGCRRHLAPTPLFRRHAIRAPEIHLLHTRQPDPHLHLPRLGRRNHHARNRLCRHDFPC